ncbi:AAA family ATPase [Mucilaginibacter ginkgonis]|uniref:AAA family ATPase n=1 Tax=Mucilaginibacter ginkgonis TaxID=2682091 RepID=A0A6I4I1H3_9SPHI|nr:AAA family ATPase [Mucilaginibacter ginkgonis]QQL48552.1 AAA family ATPase [Mucilaginibacter ginkgonis]
MSNRFLNITTNNGRADDHLYIERPPQIEMIRSMIRDAANPTTRHKAGWLDEQYDCADDLMVIRPANDWHSDTRNIQKPKMVFDNFWFENELCVLFADTNVGKSILAVQLGNTIAAGGDVRGFQMQIPACPVIYFDFEQSGNQFEARYTLERERFKFSPNFYRAELNAAAGDVRNYLDRVHACIEEGVKKTKASVLIIDNLTYLANEAEKARDAMVMMKFLKKLKSKYNLSILALAHTPKRNTAKPITNNDMQGSKMLVNFCDSVFAMGRSRKEPDMRYLKQIKQRNATELYGEDRVCLLRIIRSGDGNIFMDHAGYDAEQEHLDKEKYVSVTDKRHIADLNKEGLSCRKIAMQMGLSHTTVWRALSKMAED